MFKCLVMGVRNIAFYVHEYSNTALNNLYFYHLYSDKLFSLFVVCPCNRRIFDQLCLSSYESCRIANYIIA